MIFWYKRLLRLFEFTDKPRVHITTFCYHLNQQNLNLLGMTLYSYENNALLILILIMFSDMENLLIEL